MCIYIHSSISMCLGANYITCLCFLSKRCGEEQLVSISENKVIGFFVVFLASKIIASLWW